MVLGEGDGGHFTGQCHFLKSTSRRPGKMPFDDLWDRLEAPFAAQEAKSSSMKKKFIKKLFQVS
jgi:hypothetical protein